MNDLLGRHQGGGAVPDVGIVGPEIFVRVLGPVEVAGGARPFHRAWTLDLVVYLAMHPGGATADAWATALWPDRLVADPTRHSTVSAARRSLGTSSAGSEHLPRSSGVLRLAPTVASDWDRFRALSGPGTGASEWVEALDLVRGRPFDGLRAVDWTILEGTAMRVEDTVVQAAIRLATQCLGAGDGRGAELAVRQGLLVCPYDERLYRLLLRAADLQGNPAGVEAAMDQLVRLVASDRLACSVGRDARLGAADRTEEAMAWVHPETASLYRALSRRGASAGVSLVATGSGR